MGWSDMIIRSVRNHFGASAGEPVADGGTERERTAPRGRRANAWAGVYAAAFGAEETDDN